MKCVISIPTYNRLEFLQIAVTSILNDPTNPGLPIFVSSDSDPRYKTKEIETLKTLCDQRSSKIYYIDKERSEPYKRQLEKKSSLSREVIDIAMNGGSAGASRNRLLLLACTYGAEGVIFSDDDMEVDEGFIDHHTLALGNTISKFVSRLKNKKIPTKLSRGLNQAGLKKRIEIFSAGWRFYWQKENIYLKKSEFLYESYELGGGNLSMTNLVYSTIPFSTNIICEDYVLGQHAKIMLEPLNGIVIKGGYSISNHGESDHTDIERGETEAENFSRGDLINITRNVAKNLPAPLRDSYGREMIKRIGIEVQNFIQSSKFQEELLEVERVYSDRPNPKKITDRFKEILYENGILYQNWPDLTDAAKQIDPSILEEFLVTK